MFYKTIAMCEALHMVNSTKKKARALLLPVHLGHFAFLLRELSLQGKDFLLELSHLPWIDALRTHLGSPQLLHLCFQLWCWTQTTCRIHGSEYISWSSTALCWEDEKEAPCTSLWTKQTPRAMKLRVLRPRLALIEHRGEKVDNWCVCREQGNGRTDLGSVWHWCPRWPWLRWWSCAPAASNAEYSGSHPRC